MSRSTRTRWARIGAGLALAAIAVAVALVAADRQAAETLDAPASLPAPGVPVDLVIDPPAHGAEPAGIVWTLCCGAWRPPGDYGIDLRDRDDRRALGSIEWARRGYVAASFAAHRSARSVDEAVAAYDRLRSGYPRLPICAIGGSAAGHMALMVAARRPELRCVVAHSAPTALAEMPAEPVPGISDAPPLDLALDAFGREPLEKLSPLRHAGAIRAAVRLAACSDDRIVPPGQSRRMADALRRAGSAAEVELDVLPGRSVARGERPPRGYVHLVHDCFAAADEVEADRVATVRFVERALGPG